MKKIDLILVTTLMIMMTAIGTLTLNELGKMDTKNNVKNIIIGLK